MNNLSNKTTLTVHSSYLNLLTRLVNNAITRRDTPTKITVDVEQTDEQRVMILTGHIEKYDYEIKLTRKKDKK